MLTEGIRNINHWASKSLDNLNKFSNAELRRIMQDKPQYTAVETAAQKLVIGVERYSGEMTVAVFHGIRLPIIASLSFVEAITGGRSRKYSRR